MLLVLPSCGGKTDEASRAAGITPADALAMVSVNLDPSIEQKRNLLGIVRRFPEARKEVKGEFDEARDDLLDRLLEDSGLDFERDVKPWLGNELAVAVLPPAGGDVPVVVAMVETEDEGQARAAIEKARRGGDFEGSYSIVGDFVVISDQESEAEEAEVLDRVAAQAKADDGGLARSDAFTKVVERLHGDRLFLAWVDIKDSVGVVRDLAGAGEIDFLEWFGEKAGPAAMDLHAEEAALVVEGVTTATNDARGQEPELTTGLPASSLAAFTLFDVGQSVSEAIGLIGGTRGGGLDIVEELERETGLDLEKDILSWMEGEVVLVAGAVPENHPFPDFALVVEPSDRAKAEAGMAKLVDLLNGHGLQLEQREVAGATAHVSPEPLLAGIQPAMALFPDRFVLASRPEYLQELAKGDSPGLGDSEAYRSLFGDGGEEITGQFVALLDPIREAFETALLDDPEDRSEYERDVKPNLEPLDAFAVIARRESGFDKVEMKLTFD